MRGLKDIYHDMKITLADIAPVLEEAKKFEKNLDLDMNYEEGRCTSFLLNNITATDFDDPNPCKHFN